MVGVAVGIKNSIEVASKAPVEPVRRGLRLGGIALALTVLGTSGAWAQNCNIVSAQIPNLGQVVNLPAGAASAVAGSLGSISTAFLTQQTSAFVAGAQSTEPNQASSGVWARTVGGEVETKSNTGVDVVVANQADGSVRERVQGACASSVRQDFVGVQVGHDIARLDVAGWNIFGGLTAGYLEAKGEEHRASFDRNQIPGSLCWRICGRDLSKILR